MDEASAELFSSAFPRAEHLSLNDSGSLGPGLTAQKDGPQVVALLPAKNTPRVQEALAGALQSLLAGRSDLAVVDMDISSPRSELLGTENNEGLTDHFLYGVSPSKILRDSRHPGLKTITPGTFTPRSAEIYQNPRWKSLINWLAGETGRTVVLLGPPMERLKELPVLRYADSVMLLSEPLPQGEPPDDLQQIMDTISRSSSPETSVRMLWLREDEEAEAEQPEAATEAGEPETAGAEVEEPELEETETAELDMAAEPGIEIPELEPADTLEVPGEPAGAGLEEVSAGEPETAGAEAEEPELEEAETAELDMAAEPGIEVPELEPADTLEVPGEPAGADLEEVSAGEPEAAGAEVEEPELEETETAELDMAAEPGIEVPELEPADTLEISGEPAGADLEEVSAGEPEAAAEAGEPEIAGAEADEPELEKTETAAAEKPAEDRPPAEKEEEIFLPDELLFLDGDETRAGAGKTGEDGLGDDQLAGFNYDELPDLKTVDEEADQPSEPEGAVSTPSSEEQETVAEEAGAITREAEPAQAEEPAAGEQESPAEDELESEAFLTELEPEDEPPAEEPTQVAAGQVDESASAAAMGKMASFEEALSAPSDTEASLDLDADPLSEEESPAEGPEAGTPEPPQPTEAEAMPEAEESVTPTEAEEEPPAEELEAEALETVEPPEAETAPEAEEIETLEEMELEPVESLEPAEEGVQAKEEPAAEESPAEAAGEEGEAEEPETEALSEPDEEKLEGVEEAGPAAEQEPEAEAPPELDEEKLEEVEETGPAAEQEPEAEAPPELDEEKLEGVGEAGPAAEQGPEAEAPPELDEEELEGVEEVAAEEAPSTGEEPAESTVESLGDEDIAELEEGAEEPAAEELIEIDDEGEPAAVENGADEDLEGVDTEDMLAVDESELSDDGLDIDLDALEGEEEVQPVKKKKPSKSKARPLVFLAIVFLILAGMLYLWQPGIISRLVVEHLPPLAGMLGISSKSLSEQVETAEDLATAEEEEAVTEQEAEILEYPKLSYSIQLGSFRFLKLAVEARDQLAERGLRDAFIVPLKLDSLGDWNRLYLGFYASKSKADNALSRAAGSLGNFAGEAIVRHTPYALWIEDFPTAEALESERRLLEDNNIPSYSIPLMADASQTSGYRLFVGAYENDKQAILMRSRLYNLGLKAEIIERKGGIIDVVNPEAVKPAV